ncbi:MAG: MiaB/RimO family radical SAM methylthiotransferase [Desulfovibrio sp.]|nr:MiaB/RimO family radical SAM methylthiotransferase [Desulfovibrio sp.]
MHPWRFFIVTFGCKVNQYESQALREAWEKLGGTECETPDAADVICVNSCAITAKGERAARDAIFQLRRKAPSARLVLTGCASKLFQNYRPRPHAIWAEPDVIVPQQQKSLLLTDPTASVQPQPLTQIEPTENTTFPPFQISAFRRSRPVLKLQDGCTHRCTYCIVPFTRGATISRPPEEVLSEARRLFEAGYAEIVLSGVNLNQYGRDKPSFGDFWDLLRMLENDLAEKFAERARFRISSLEPSQLHARALAILKASRMVCPHLHISLQHASPAVLKRMGRGHYTGRMLTNALAALAEHWPVMGLGADILVGFPGETEEDMRLLLAYIEKVPFSYAHVFPWSSRPGTAAADFDDQPARRIKYARAARVRAAIEQCRRRFLQSQLALPRMLVAAENASEKTGARRGVNEYYAPCFFQDRGKVLSGLVVAKPVGLTKNGILVELMV